MGDRCTDLSCACVDLRDCMWEYAHAVSEIMWWKGKGRDVQWFASGRFPSRDKGAKPNSVPRASECSSDYSRLLSWNVGIWRFIETRSRNRTDSAGPIGVNLFAALLLVKKISHGKRARL